MVAALLWSCPDRQRVNERWFLWNCTTWARPLDAFGQTSRPMSQLSAILVALVDGPERSDPPDLSASAVLLKTDSDFNSFWRTSNNCDTLARWGNGVAIHERSKLLIEPKRVVSPGQHGLKSPSHTTVLQLTRFCENLLQTHASVHGFYKRMRTWSREASITFDHARASKPQKKFIQPASSSLFQQVIIIIIINSYK